MSFDYFTKLSTIRLTRVVRGLSKEKSEKLMTYLSKVKVDKKDEKSERKE